MKNINIEYIFNKFKVYKSIFYNFITNEWKILLAIFVTVNLLLITIILNKQIFKNLIKYINNNINNNLTIENYNNFLFINRYILIFLFIIWIGICFDKRFSLNRKVLMPILFILFILILLILRGNFLINELFWYSIILNTSFIFHVCICDWLYRLFEYYKLEYLSFIITRISFILSLSFIMYLCERIIIKILIYSKKEKSKRKKIFDLIFKLVLYLITLIELILLFFINLFSNYTHLVLGSKIFKSNIIIVIKVLSFLLITAIISIFILGIPRLYFIWFLLIFSYIYKLLKKYKINKKFWVNMQTDIEEKIEILENDYKNENTGLFNYGFIEYINLTHKLLNDKIYNFYSPFTYLPRKILILTYIKSYCKSYKINESNYYIYDIYVISSLEKSKKLFLINNDEFIYWELKILKLFKNRIKKFKINENIKKNI